MLLFPADSSLSIVTILEGSTGCRVHNSAYRPKKRKNVEMLAVNTLRNVLFNLFFLLWSSNSLISLRLQLLHD